MALRLDGLHGRRSGGAQRDDQCKGFMGSHVLMEAASHLLGV